MTTRLQAAAEKLRQKIDGRYEAKRQAATATVTDVARDTKTGHTTGMITATIDGVSNQRVFVGAGTGVRVGDNLRVENRGSGVAPEWLMLGKDGSPAGAEGVVDVERLLSTPGGLTLASDAYAATNGAGILANVAAQWSQTPDWEAPAYYEVSYYRVADGASKAHVSRAPHTNGAATAQLSILNLLPGTEYVLAVRAVGYGGGLSAWTAEQSITTATDATVPAVPSGLAAAEVTPTSLRFYWNRNTEADFWYYEIGVSTSAGTGGMLAGYPRSAGDTPEHVATVTPVTNYYFRVRALDTSSNPSAWSNWSGPHATAKGTIDVLDMATLIDTDFGLGIKASGKIGIDLASPSGLSFASGDLRIDDSIAGAGLAMASKVLGVGAGNGISVAADSVAVNQGYAFAWTANHSWTGSLQHPSYASQTTNWQISAAGAADFRYLYADEMHVKSFIADLEQALAGGQIISKSVAMLSRNFTAPAAGATATLYVWDLPSAENMAVFQSGDVVRLRSFSRAAGSLTVADCWGVVTSYSNLAGKEQSWTFTRSTAPNAGAMSAGSVVQADALVLDYGTTGNGYHEVNAIDGAYAANSPYSQVATWTGHPATGQTVRTRTGNLTGLAFPSQPANEYGFYAGDGRAVDDKYIRISTWGAELHNLPLRIYDGSIAKIVIEPDTPSIRVGDRAELITYDSTETGIFIGKRTSTGDYTFRVGNTTQYIKWDGSDLEVSGLIKVTNGSDIAEPKYRVSQSALWDLSIKWTGSGTVTLGGNVAVGSTGGMALGIITTELGNQFILANIPSSSGVASATVDTDYQDIVMYVLRDGTGITNPATGSDYAGMDNPYVSVTFSNYVEVFFENADTYADIVAYPAATKANHTVVGLVRLNSTFTGIDGAFGSGTVGTTIIGPGYVKTDYLSAFATDLGIINAGSIEVGSTNKLWLNVGNDSLKLAVGGSARASAPFRVYETGRTVIGDSGGSYIEWNTPTLTVSGVINATSGTLGSLNVTGNLTMDGGQIRWSGGNSYIDNSIIRVSDASTTSLLRIGDATQTYHGLVNIDMAQGAGTGWGFGIRVRDGGNTSTQVQGLYFADSWIAGDAAVDRLFYAKSSTGSHSDGFYAEMGSGGSGGSVAASINASAYWDSKGAGVKIDNGGSAPGMLINNKNAANHQPAIWATAHQGSATAMLYALLTGSGQTGLEVSRVNGSGVAVKTNGAPIQMGWGEISGIGKIILRNGGDASIGTGIGSSVPANCSYWMKVFVESDGRTFYIPMFAF